MLSDHLKLESTHVSYGGGGGGGGGQNHHNS